MLLLSHDVALLWQLRAESKTGQQMRIGYEALCAMAGLWQDYARYCNINCISPWA